MDSILRTIKKMIGGVEDDDFTGFDTDLIVHINSALRILNQLGVGAIGFNITGLDETWNDFLGKDEAILSEVKTYIYLKVKLVFDPPSNSFTQQSMKDEIKELEWRMNVEVDPRLEEVDEP